MIYFDFDFATFYFLQFYLVAKGQGDQHDNRARARGVTASFSLNGISVTNEEPLDLNRENEELKVKTG